VALNDRQSRTAISELTAVGLDPAKNSLHPYAADAFYSIRLREIRPTTQSQAKQDCANTKRPIAALPESSEHCAVSA
jgi:hypothetical protein